MNREAYVTVDNRIRFRSEFGDRRYVLTDDSGHSAVPKGFSIDSDVGKALASLFQNRNDERLGRWRWPENPDYVVYPDEEEDLKVLDESTGLTHYYYTRNDSRADSTSIVERAAAAYFEVHRAPTPWREAEAGQVWHLETDNASAKSGTYVVTEIMGLPRFIPVGHSRVSHIGLNATAIKGGYIIPREDGE